MFDKKLQKTPLKMDLYLQKKPWIRSRKIDSRPELIPEQKEPQILLLVNYEEPGRGREWNMCTRGVRWSQKLQL